jgi:hypothetical protein
LFFMLGQFRLPYFFMGGGLECFFL